MTRHKGAFAEIVRGTRRKGSPFLWQPALSPPLAIDNMPQRVSAPCSLGPFPPLMPADSLRLCWDEFFLPSPFWPPPTDLLCIPPGRTLSHPSRAQTLLLVVKKACRPHMTCFLTSLLAPQPKPRAVLAGHGGSPAYTHLVMSQFVVRCSGGLQTGLNSYRLAPPAYVTPRLLSLSLSLSLCFGCIERLLRS